MVVYHGNAGGRRTELALGNTILDAPPLIGFRHFGPVVRLFRLGCCDLLFPRDGTRRMSGSP